MIRKMNSPLWFLTPYVMLFVVFIVIPVIIAIVLSFTYFNTIETPEWVGLRNYIELMTRDEVFMQYVYLIRLSSRLLSDRLGI